MKKIFSLQHEKKKPERLLEAVKNDIRNYLKRERRKTLPDDALFWDFDCRFGQTEESADSLLAPEIMTALDKALEAKWEQCYIEIIAKPSFESRPKPEVLEDEKTDTAVETPTVLDEEA